MQVVNIFEIIESGNWEKLIYYIVEFENLNPYDIDLVKLCDKFLEYVNRARELDFRIPAKVLYIAIFLLKLKVDLLFPQEQEIQEEIREILELPKIDISNLELSLPTKRLPISQITLEELIDSLRKVLALKEKKEYRKKLRKQIEERFKDYFEEMDIEKIIQQVYERVENLLKSKEKIFFDEILQSRNFREFYSTFFSILHLELQQKIKTFQEKPFDKIVIEKYSKESL
ncbi:MAG: segregation/condensation protein A [Candidatus Aenigmatarchaeota archaeon]